MFNNKLRTMGIVRSKIIRVMRRYNVEHRAQKIMEKEKEQPRAAPWHPSTNEQKKLAEEANPNFMEEHYKKDPELHDRLKSIYVSSRVIGITDDKSTKALPQTRTIPEEPIIGFWEPKNVQYGRCHLTHAIQFMADNAIDKKQNTPESIAQQYKLDIKDVENVLNNFKIFQIMNTKKQKENEKKSFFSKYRGKLDSRDIEIKKLK